MCYSPIFPSRSPSCRYSNATTRTCSSPCSWTLAATCSATFRLQSYGGYAPPYSRPCWPRTCLATSTACRSWRTGGCDSARGCSGRQRQQRRQQLQRRRPPLLLLRVAVVHFPPSRDALLLLRVVVYTLLLLRVAILRGRFRTSSAAFLLLRVERPTSTRVGRFRPSFAARPLSTARVRGTAAESVWEETSQRPPQGWATSTTKKKTSKWVVMVMTVIPRPCFDASASVVTTMRGGTRGRSNFNWVLLDSRTLMVQQ